MKLYVTTTAGQANNALKDFVSQKVSFITSNLVFKGTLRMEKKTGKYYVRNKKERIDIRPAEVNMIVDNHIETKIITSL